MSLLEWSKKQKKVLVWLMIGILFILFFLGITLALYSYLVKIEGKNGETWSLVNSPYNYDSKFFKVSSYNIVNFPLIPKLLISLKVGIILALVSGVIIFNYFLISWLISTAKLIKFKNINLS